MIHIGVAIMYITIGLVTYRFADFFKINKNRVSHRIGKCLYVSGIVIFFGCISTLLPGVPNVTSTIVLGITVTIMAIVMLKTIREFRDRINYGEFYFANSIRSRDKKKFDVGFKKFPETIFEPGHIFDLVELLAEEGLLELWLEDKKHKFTEEQKEKIESFRLLDVMKREEW
ncbi:hypothetical protein [Bacillus thuringiensis]|uniref:hypothetical protein n=1 Tax=Bacillus thuringiensis TaxID=1428 RepID=UPI0021D65899|nr:hypothetical protein [Bacillus thuringiensis]MCU7667342.1 hypothetical protein [Bacillus thuringiensis]